MLEAPPGQKSSAPKARNYTPYEKCEIWQCVQYSTAISRLCLESDELIAAPLIDEKGPIADLADLSTTMRRDHKSVRCRTGVCTENLIRVDAGMESPKLAE